MIHILPVSQFTPVNPAAQTHVNPLMWSWHVAPFIQGSAAHSLISVPKQYNYTMIITLAEQ